MAVLPRNDIGGIDNRVAFRRVCVEVALAAAEMGAPINRRQKLIEWQLDRIERAAGFRPSHKEVKDILEQAVTTKRLRYIAAPAGAHVKAGYYAFEDTNVDPSMRGAINSGEVSVDQKSRAAANTAALQEFEGEKLENSL